VIEVLHVITVGKTRVELKPDEARVVIRGDIPKRLAKLLEQRGIKLPPRGTIPFHIERVEGDLVVFRSEAHMRRVA
jgi:hypothetical protein